MLLLTTCSLVLVILAPLVILVTAAVTFVVVRPMTPSLDVFPGIVPLPAAIVLRTMRSVHYHRRHNMHGLLLLPNDYWSMLIRVVSMTVVILINHHNHILSSVVAPVVAPQAAAQVAKELPRLFQGVFIWGSKEKERSNIITQNCNNSTSKHSYGEKCQK